MPKLLNQFELKPTVDFTAFEEAWKTFVEHLVTTGMAQKGTPLCKRIPESGYDTDEQRNHSLMAVIEFEDQTQADVA